MNVNSRNVLAFALLLIVSGCRFDLVEVEPEVRRARVSVLVETRLGEDIHVLVALDPGTTDRGVTRELAHEDLGIDGGLFAPAELLENGTRVYDVDGISASTESITIIPPAIIGIGEVRGLVIVPLRVAPLDSLMPDSSGVLKVPVMGTEWPAVHGSWTASLYLDNQSAPQLTVNGTHPVPAILRIPTSHLAAEVLSGRVEIKGASSSVAETGDMLQTTVQRTMYASVPFRNSQ